MAWELQWGDKREFLQKLVEQGQTPEALKTQPRLRPWVAEQYRAFQMLSASRPVGMGGVGAIPLSEIAVYLDLFEVHDFDERDAYITMIQALDSVYLKHMAQKASESAPKTKAKPPRKRR